MTALEESVLPLFNEFMPDPVTKKNDKTGLIVREYCNTSGNIFEVRT
jgi:hypothetical protein